MRGLEHLHPVARIRANELLADCKAARLNVLITDTLRTVEEQNELFARGRDAQGNRIGKTVTRCRGTYFESPHQWGVAFDFCRNERGREYDDTDNFFAAVGARAKRLGLFWGGDFAGFTDKPHLELPEFLPRNSTDALKRRYTRPELFIATWPSAFNDVAGLVAGMLEDGVIQDSHYWHQVLQGNKPADAGFLFTLLERYRKLVNHGTA